MRSGGVALTLYPDPFGPAIEPRMRFRWRPDGTNPPSLHAAMGLYRQTLIGVSDERDAGSVFLARLPGPLDGLQMQAIHVPATHHDEHGRSWLTNIHHARSSLTTPHPSLSRLRLDLDHPVRSTGTIDSRRRGIFENANRIDVVNVDVYERRVAG